MRPLPVGSFLSGSQFGWMPPVGYVGPYELAFVRGAECAVRVEGWAFDPLAAIGSGIGAVGRRAERDRYRAVTLASCRLAT